MMMGLVLLLIILPISLAEVCSPKVYGNLSPSLVYRPGLFDKLIEEGEHTVLYSDGYQADAAYLQARVPSDLKVCLRTSWRRDATGLYRDIDVFDDKLFKRQLRIKIIAHPLANHLVEVWPNGHKFNVYFLHLEAGVLGMYACEVHQEVLSDGTPVHRDHLRSYYGLSIRTAEVKSKASLRNTWVSAGLSKLRNLGLGFTTDDKLFWCYRDTDPDSSDKE